MICKLVSGETCMKTLTEFIHPRCRSSKKDIEKALEGTLTDKDRNVLKSMIKHVACIESLIGEVDKQIETYLKPYHAQVELLQTIPGVQYVAAASLVAELGVDMNQFRDAFHLSSWAGLCPGNNQSAGKIKSSRIRHGNRHVKITMTQCAWAVSRTKKTYLGAKYRTLALRRGRKRAIIAIGRKLLVICYHMLKENVPFHELGLDFLDNLEPERKAKYHEKRLEELGYNVQVTKKIA